MSVRAGIVVTGTEVLSGIIRDENGPWLSERLRGLGVTLSESIVVGDRPDDLRASLDFLAAQGMDLIITSGGLGPTADDLTAEVVAAFAGRPLAVDPGARGARVGDRRADAATLARCERGRDAGGRAQAGARARGRCGAGARRDRARLGRAGRRLSRRCWCCRGRRASCSRCGRPRCETAPLRALLARAGVLEQRIMR